MINFSNATLLSYSHEPKFLGDSSFNYRIEKNYKIKGFIDNLMNSNGVEKTVSGVSAFLASANDFNDIVIGGFNLGKGRVKSISFAAGNWVRMADYDATITIFDSGNLSNMVGPYYSGIQDTLYSSGADIPLIDSIDENFSFSVDSNNEYSFDHTLELKLISGGDNTATCAKAIASGFLTSVAPFGFLNAQYSGFYERPSKRFYTEAYDLINGKYSFSEKFSTKGSNPFYSLEITHAMNINKDGISTITENGKIKGIVENLFDYATSGYNDQIAGTFARCSDFYNQYGVGYYYDDPNGLVPLVTEVREKSIETNNFEGTFNYSYRYDNDLNRKNLYFIDKETSHELNEDLVTYKTTYRGSVIGHGKMGTEEKINNALLGYNTIFIPEEQLGGVGVLLEKNMSIADYKGEVKYSYLFNASPVYMLGDILKYVKKVSTTPSFPDMNDIYMGGRLYAIPYSQDTIAAKVTNEETVYRHQLLSYACTPTMTFNTIKKDETFTFNYPGNTANHSLSILEG